MGSGFKTFTAAEVLTAADLNNYCQTQSVMYFATTAARDAAITSPVAGMVAFIDSGDANEGLHVYHNATGGWRKGPGWNAPWGYVNYTEVTSNVTNGHNANILTSTISVVNNRRYHLSAQIPGYFSTAANNNASVFITVGGTVIAELRVSAFRANNADIGGAISGYYTATATNASLSANLYSAALTGINHQYIAAATKPISLLVQDIGPSGAPA